MERPTRIQCKRAYDSVSHEDGCRVLVDRMWPRGIRKESLPLDAWEKELAPSRELRQWFGHDSRRWAGFYQKYHKELRDKPECLDKLLECSKGRTLTLIYSAKDSEYNNAVVLKAYIEDVIDSG